MFQTYLGQSSVQWGKRCGVTQEEPHAEGRWKFLKSHMHLIVRRGRSEVFLYLSQDTSTLPSNQWHVHRCILARFKPPHFAIAPMQHRAQYKLIFFSSLAEFLSHSDRSVRSILHAVPSIANFKPGCISVLNISQWYSCISVARTPSCCRLSCSNLSMRTESATNRRQQELCYGSLGTTSLPTSRLIRCCCILVVSCLISSPLIPASLLYLMWCTAETSGAQGQYCKMPSTVWSMIRYCA